MSEYKFSCPNCDQHLSGTPAWAGRSLTCPTCQKEFTVPAPPVGSAPPPAAVAVARAAAAPTAAPRPAAAPVRNPIRAADLPRVPGAAPAPGATASGPAMPAKSNGLAIASLCCGIASMVGFGCVGGLPAVICGHLAMSRIKSGRAPTGRGMAIAGLVLGYLSLVITVAVMILYAVFFKQALAQAQAQMQRNQPPTRSIPVTPDRNTPPGRNRNQPGNADRGNRPERGNRAPATAGVITPQRAENDPPVNTDPAAVAIPATPVSGTVGGEPFKLGKAVFNSSMNLLTLQEGTDMAAEKDIKIFFFPSGGGSVLGQSSSFTPGSGTGRPHVHYNGGSQGGAEVGNYALKVELGQPQGGKVKGKLYVELGQSKGTKVAGTFEAVVQK